MPTSPQAIWKEFSVSSHAILKARTAAAHLAVEADFSRFDLGCRESYISFLLTHARVLPAAEGILAKEIGLPQWRQRTDLIGEDLRGFGYMLPEPENISEALDQPEKFGLLYVLEGSRLGGHVLSRRVGRDFPKQFLSAVHMPGEWLAFKMALESRAEVEDGNWLEGVIAGANRGVELYALSIRQAFSR